MRKKLLKLCCIICLCIPLAAENKNEAEPLLNFQFIRQPITDIVYALSVYSKIPIVVNKTVDGTAQFQFSGNDFEQAFDTFIALNDLYVEKNEHVWTVTRVLIRPLEEGHIKLDASEVELRTLIEYLARETGTTVAADILPHVTTSIHIQESTVQEAISLIMKPYSDYTVSVYDTYLSIKKNPAQAMQASQMPSYMLDIKETGGLFTVRIQKGVLQEILDSLFKQAKREYSSFVNGTQTIERLDFAGKPFEEALSYVLEQAGAEYAEKNRMYYIFPVQQSEIINKLKREGKQWNLFKLKYKNIQEVTTLLQAQFPDVSITPLADNTGFFALMLPDKQYALSKWLESIDYGPKSMPIKLKYIRTEDLLKKLPPSANQNNIIDVGDGNSFFYVGSEERRKAFLKDIAYIDRPHAQLRYDLLIVQYQSTDNFKWNFNVAARGLKPGDQTLVSGVLGSLLSLNFDAISVFGYQFAAKLSTAMGSSEARIFADTMLYGLSGQEIKFQNTSTYRYRDSNVDPETGKPKYTGITREITSGLMLTINGWVSGEGVITTTITASISKRGADVALNTGNPPPTSEKIITTQVRSQSGEPVILSGLKQNEMSNVEEGVPGVSKIPVAGLLFKDKVKTTEKTEMVIYLVPHIDYSGDDGGNGKLRRDTVFERLVAPHLAKRNF